MAKDDDQPFRMTLSQLCEESSKRDRLPLSLSIDTALNGGIPYGSTVIVAGKSGLGKTSLCFEYASRAQKTYKSKIFVFPIEGRLSNAVPDQVKGLDRENVEVIYPPAIFDKKGNRVGYKRLSAEKWWQIIGETMVANPKSILIVDSLANFISERELSEDLGYQTRGLRQQLESDFARRYGATVSSTQCILFLITQMQANTGGMPGSPTTSMKVGSQLQFQADLILLGTWAEKWGEQSGVVLGHDMWYEIRKNSFGRPNSKIKLPLRYGSGIDIVKDLINHCIEFEIIKKTGAWYTLPFLEMDGKFIYKSADEFTDDDKPLKKQGEESIRIFLSENPEQIKILDEIIRKKVFG